MSLARPQIMKLDSLQGTILLQSSFPRTRESRFVLGDLAWIPVFTGMTDHNRNPASCYHFALVFSKDGLMSLRTLTENENTITLDAIYVMLSVSAKHLLFAQTRSRFFGGVYPESAEGHQNDILSP